MKVRIYKELFKQSIEEFMIYRMTASLTVLFGIMFYGIELLAGVVYFQYTDSIMGLTRTDYMILITTANIIQMGYQFLFVASHEMLEETIIEGGLDYALIRPVNSFFYYSFQRIDIASAIGLLVSIVCQCYFMRGLNLTGLSILGYVIGVLMGVWFLFLINQNIVMLSFWVEKSSKITGIPEYLFELVSRPRGIYPNVVVWVLSYVVPFFSAVNLPIEIINGNKYMQGCAYYAVFLIIISVVTYVLWNKGLRRYVSAN